MFISINTLTKDSVDTINSHQLFKKYQYQINNNNNFHGVQYLVDCGRSCCYAVMLGGSNHIWFTTNVNAQLVHAEETREDLRAVIVKEKLQKVVPCIGM